MRPGRWDEKKTVEQIDQGRQAEFDERRKMTSPILNYCPCTLQVRDKNKLYLWVSEKIVLCKKLKNDSFNNIH